MSGGQKLLNVEVDERIIINLDRSIKKIDEGVNGLMTFGQLNDYPQIIEKLINGSTTAKAAASMYSRFLVGHGFENEALNDIQVGTDSRGKKITLKSLLGQVGNSSANNNGYYIHCNITNGGEVENAHLKQFKNCRFAKPDDTGYSAKILYYEDWANNKSRYFSRYNKAFDKGDIKAYNVFNLTESVYIDQIKKAGGIDSYKGQVYFQFLDNQYFYPLSPFDPSYLDCDSEAQISLFKNRQLRNGFLEKLLFSVAPGGSDQEKEDFVKRIKSFAGPDGESAFIVDTDVNEDGQIDEQKAIKVDKIESNINDKLFENWEKGLANSIRKCARNIPMMLIEIQDSIFSNQSGEAIKQATNFYNALTADDRSVIEESFQEIFSKSTNKVLRENKNWKIKPLSLIETEQDGTTTEPAATAGN